MNKLIFPFYFLLLISFSLFSFAFVDPNLTYLKEIYTGFAFQEREFTTFLYVVFILISFVFYSSVLKNIRTINFSSFKLLIGITFAVLIFSYPAFLSFDIFNYITTAKTLFFYGENPYIVMPIEFTGEPLLLFTHAANKIALYGPFWIGLTSVPFFLGLGNFLLMLFSFKAFIALFYLAIIFLIWKMTKNLFSVAFFALNPLVIMETLMSAHNDIVMMFFALLSFFILQKKKILLAILFLIFSVLIKYATAFLIPIFIYALLKTLKKEKIDWQKIFLISFLSMLAIFLLSPLREEIYPWYAIWFLPFAVFITNKKVILYVSLAFSFGLLFRYVPFMFLGTHFGITPLIKTLVTFIPPALVLIYFFFKNKLWLKISS